MNSASTPRIQEYAGWFPTLGHQYIFGVLSGFCISCLLGAAFGLVLFSCGFQSYHSGCILQNECRSTFELLCFSAILRPFHLYWILIGVILALIGRCGMFVNFVSKGVVDQLISLIPVGRRCCSVTGSDAPQGYAVSSNAFRQGTTHVPSKTKPSFRAMFRFCVWCVTFCRIGEATVPGPSDVFVIGVCNPSGLPSKAFLFNSYHADLWLVSETHLTRPGLRTFRRALNSLQSPYRWIVHGNEALPRSQVSDVGKWTGVAAIAKWPTRRMVHDWDPGIHATGRLVASTSCIGELWVSGITVYGTPVGPTHPGARETTETLLRAATKRAIQAVGCRFIAGDFNCDHDKSPAIAQLRACGFQDLQDLQFRITGCLPQPTCRGRTRRDFLFVSPELANRFIQCEINSYLWPDHAAVFGVFQAQRCSSIRSIWHIPQPLDWSIIPSTHTGEVISFAGCEDCTELYAEMWKQKEQQVVDSAASKGIIVSPNCLGRAAQVHPKRSNANCPPVKAGRTGDRQPSFLGFSMLHLKWFRQLRRLDNYVKLVEHAPLSHSQQQHCSQLWKSICIASGFPPSFVVWWSTRSHCIGEVQTIPSVPPGFEVASLILQAFEWEVKTLEKSLIKHRNYDAKLRAKSSIQQLFRSVKRDQPEQVDVLIQDVQAPVMNVCEDECAVEFATEQSWKLELPFYHNGKQLEICHAEPDKLWISNTQGIQPGDPIVQPRRVGNLDALFDAFREQWNARWNRHTDIPVDRWRVIVDFARAVIPQVQHPPLQVNPGLLRSIIKSKKKTSATGLDGVSRADLMASSTNDLLSLMSIFAEAESSGRWPEQMLTGTVRSLAKCREPATPNHFRPITVFSLVYRLWSSSQSRYWLTRLDNQLDQWQFGNRSHRRAADMWRIILDEVEEHHLSSESISGVVLDLEKAFNTLPRYPTMATSLALGIHESTLIAWSGALSDMARHFSIQGSLSDALYSNCGFAEGCGMSCVAMLAIDHLYHLWVQHSCCRTKALSFVDNWEIIINDERCVAESFQRVLEFAELLDLTVDKSKTFGWSTSAQGRSRLKQAGFVVKYDGRDLGAHISYSRQIRNSSIEQKIVDLEDFWEKLFYCQGAHSQKCRLIATCAWPRALHAISSSFLGKKHWVSLRTRAIRSLRLDVAGASPLLLLHVERFGLDPLAYAILSTVRDFREFGATDEHLLRLSVLNQGCSESGYQSVTEVLTSRLHTLGWNWTSGSNVVDQIGEFSLADAGMAEVSFRLRRSWHNKIAMDLHSRESFSDFHRVDPVATCQSLGKRSQFERATLRAYLSGATFTNAQAFRWTTTGSTLCAACGSAQDSVYHRLWNCPVVNDLKAMLEPDLCEIVPHLPLAASVHGWTLESAHQIAWLQYLDGLNREIPAPLVPLDGPCVDLFTDGSCFWNRTSYAVASWSVVLAGNPSLELDHEACKIVAADALPGVIQSAYRAELYALLVAATFIQQLVWWVGFGLIVLIWLLPLGCS